ncbi:unnamed protein product [Arctogadus glacialis]
MQVIAKCPPVSWCLQCVLVSAVCPGVCGVSWCLRCVLVSAVCPGVCVCVHEAEDDVRSCNLPPCLQQLWKFFNCY